MGKTQGLIYPPTMEFNLNFFWAHAVGRTAPAEELLAVRTINKLKINGK